MWRRPYWRGALLDDVVHDVLLRDATGAAVASHRAHVSGRRLRHPRHGHRVDITVKRSLYIRPSSISVSLVAVATTLYKALTSLLTKR